MAISILFSTTIYSSPVVAHDAISTGILASSDMSLRVKACAACHGAKGEGDTGYFPRLAGQPEAYLFEQLQAFRDGRRRYPAMTYLTTHLSDAYLHDMAKYFSALPAHPPRPALPLPLADKAVASKPDAPGTDHGTVLRSARAAMLAEGERWVYQGDARRGIAACTQCHGARLTGQLPSTPGLLGLSADYLVAQMGAFRSGVRPLPRSASEAHPPIKHPSIELDDRVIRAVSQWLAAQPFPTSSAAVIDAAPSRNVPSETSFVTLPHTLPKTLD